MRRFVILAILLILATGAFAQFTYTSIDHPGAVATSARGINNAGEIVGAWRTTPPGRAVLFRKGQFTDVVLQFLGSRGGSGVFKINDRGDMVGQVVDDFGSHGFLVLKDGTFTRLDCPGFDSTVAFGLNNSRTVVGLCEKDDADGNPIAQTGFIWKDGVFRIVNYKDTNATAFAGINERGDIVGLWSSNITDAIGHGLVVTNSDTFTFDVPVEGVIQTQANDINAQGQIVGLYITADGSTHGFLMTGSTFTPIDYPDPATTLTSAWGINSAGQIVGSYALDFGPGHGYIATPAPKGKPE